jgi:hypothetical protein
MLHDIRELRLISARVCIGVRGYAPAACSSDLQSLLTHSAHELTPVCVLVAVHLIQVTFMSHNMLHIVVSNLFKVLTRGLVCQRP